MCTHCNCVINVRSRAVWRCCSLLLSEGIVCSKAHVHIMSYAHAHVCTHNQLQALEERISAARKGVEAATAAAEEQKQQVARLHETLRCAPATALLQACPAGVPCCRRALLQARASLLAVGARLTIRLRAQLLKQRTQRFVTSSTSSKQARARRVCGCCGARGQAPGALLDLGALYVIDRR